MKKVLMLIIIIGVVAVTGCGKINKKIEDINKEQQKQKKENAFKMEASDRNDIRIYIDKETGVNYIVYNNPKQAGMTVRVNADGTPYVSEEYK